MNGMLRDSILRSNYFKEDLYQLTNFYAVLDEAREQVKYAEPWTSGAVGMPSTMFCCLFKFMTLKLNLK